MKSDDIKRSVRSQRHDRHAGDAPNMGRVTRMPGTGLPKGERRKRKRSEGGRNSKVRQGRALSIKIWSVMLLFAALVCLGVGLWFGLRPGEEKLAGHAAPLPVEEVKPSRISRFPTPSEEETVEIVKKGLATREVAEVSNHFRTDIAQPAGVVEFLSSLPTRDGTVGNLEWLGSMDANNLQLEGVIVHFNSEKPRNRIALLTPDPQGVWKMDFDAFARTVEPSWPDFLEKRADTIQARIYVGRDSYYNGPFSDESQWTCYGLASPDTDEVYYGYCKVNSPQAAALNRILSKDASLGRATVEMKRVPDAQARQYLISRVIAEDWVTGSVAFDQGFE
ncbi:MAG: hypothetical protein EOP88_07035 [Verrucomicrobiaceae bacterium]|nr:MAG: hypothetical protein EOP88_07035 [Verrucomicrobiaceae bacterium]